MTLIDYAKSFIATPYIFSGNSPLGWDCSGFICEVLKSHGHLRYNTDLSSQGLYSHFRKVEGMRSQLGEGSLLFFGKSREEISHVSLALNEFLMIECGGGDSRTRTLEDAAKRGAFVRIRPIKTRKDFIACLKFQ